MCVPWESNPQPFALLMQCSTTELQGHLAQWFEVHFFFAAHICIWLWVFATRFCVWSCSEYLQHMLLCWWCFLNLLGIFYLNVFFHLQCIYIYIYAFSRRFYPKRLTVHSGYTFFCQYVCSLGIEPTTFALLMQCSNHWATGTLCIELSWPLYMHIAPQTPF